MYALGQVTSEIVFGKTRKDSTEDEDSTSQSASTWRQLAFKAKQSTVRTPTDTSRTSISHSIALTTSAIWHKAYQSLHFGSIDGGKKSASQINLNDIVLTPDDKSDHDLLLAPLRKQVPTVLIPHLRENPFDNLSVRQGFLKRTLLLLIAKLLFILGVVSLFSLVPPIHEFVQKDWHWHMAIAFMAVYVLLNFSVCIYPRAFIKPPLNWVLLVSVAVAIAGMMAFFTKFTQHTCIIATGTTTLWVMLMTVMVAKKWDTHTQVSLVVMVVVTAVVYGPLFVVTTWVVEFITSLELIVAALITCVLNAAILLKTYMRIEGKNTLEPDMHVYAAATVFLDLLCWCVRGCRRKEADSKVRPDRADWFEAV